MATFHGRSDLTIMIDDLRTAAIFEHCLSDMFVFHQNFLHIFKDVSYDSNNLVSNSLYQILTTSSQGDNGLLVVIVITLLVIT